MNNINVLLILISRSSINYHPTHIITSHNPLVFISHHAAGVGGGGVFAHQGADSSNEVTWTYRPGWCIGADGWR